MLPSVPQKWLSDESNNKTGYFFCLFLNVYFSLLLLSQNTKAETSPNKGQGALNPNEQVPMNITSQSSTPQCVCHIVDPNGRPVASQQGISQNYNNPHRYPSSEEMEYDYYSSYNQYGNAGVESVQYESFYANNLINDSITYVHFQSFQYKNI